jgi:hypothetical protein
LDENMNDIKDYAASITFSAEVVAEMPADIVQRELDRMQKDAIWKSIKQVGENWVCIKVSTECIKHIGEFGNSIEYRTRIRCRDVLVERVYIPTFSKLPSDVYECKWCGGWTYNDDRGHCRACGGPRNLKYLEDG